MSGFNRTVTEMFLHPEHINPGFRQRESNCNVLARNLPVFATDVTRDEDIGA